MPISLLSEHFWTSISWLVSRSEISFLSLYLLPLFLFLFSIGLFFSISFQLVFFPLSFSALSDRGHLTWWGTQSERIFRPDLTFSSVGLSGWAFVQIIKIICPMSFHIHCQALTEQDQRETLWKTSWLCIAELIIHINTFNIWDIGGIDRQTDSRYLEVKVGHDLLLMFSPPKISNLRNKKTTYLLIFVQHNPPQDLALVFYFQKTK